MFERAKRRFARRGNGGGVATAERPAVTDGDGTQTTRAPVTAPPPAPETRAGGAVAAPERPATRAPAGTRARAGRDAIVLDREARLRQRERFGGLNWGAAFFGWLVAIGMGALLTAIVSGAGTAIGLTDNTDTNAHAETIGIVGGALLIAIAVVAYFCGGYVAGRMSRFDGARQGLGVWVLGLIMTLVIAAAGWIFGDQYNLFEKLDLPRIPIDASDLTTGGVIALAAIAVGSLIAAIIGGIAGRRYHSRVDRAAVAD